MPLQSHILDNQVTTVGDYLRRNLLGADAFDLASACFTIYGYELVAEELDRVGRVRFLFGDPTSVEGLDPGADEPKSFEFTERGLEPNHTKCSDGRRSDSQSGLMILKIWPGHSP